MAFRPREVVVRAREAAALILAALEREGMVAQFLDAYAKEHRRSGFLAQPARYREMLETIRREALLAVAVRIEAQLPRRLTASAQKRPRGDEDNLTDLFRQEFFLALGVALEWGKAELEGFFRDLDLYKRLSPPAATHRQPRKRAPVMSGPFADRCGLLLDPSMLEEARQAAGRFQSKLEQTADRVLRKVFSRRREN